MTPGAGAPALAAAAAMASASRAADRGDLIVGRTVSSIRHGGRYRRRGWAPLTERAAQAPRPPPAARRDSSSTILFCG